MNNKRPAVSREPDARFPISDEHRKPEGTDPAEVEDEEADDPPDEECWYAQITTHIVGRQYYQGEIDNKQRVELRCGTGTSSGSGTKPYTKICNDRGEQIGSLAKEIAENFARLVALAPPPDSHSQEEGQGVEESMHYFPVVRVEGEVPSGAQQVYKVPLVIQVYGTNLRAGRPRPLPKLQVAQAAASMSSRNSFGQSLGGCGGPPPLPGQQFFPRGPSGTTSIEKEQLPHDPVEAKRTFVREQLNRILGEIQRTKCQYADVKVVRVPAGIPVHSLTRDVWRREFGDQEKIPGFLTARRVGGGSSGARIDNVDIQRDFQTALEKLYTTSTTKYEDMPSINDDLNFSPIDGKRTPLLGGGFDLLEHQKKALWWLVQREKCPEKNLATEIEQGKVPLWKVVVAQQPAAAGTTNSATNATAKKFVNTATNATRKSAPDIPRGGFLCDEMGLGKTISILAVIAHDLHFAHSCTTSGAGAHAHAQQGHQHLPQHAANATLILCPKSVLSPWEDAILAALVNDVPGRTTTSSTSRVKLHVCHGPDAGTAWDRVTASLKMQQQQRSHHIVLSTYETYANLVQRTTWCSHLQWHRVVLDEAHRIRNDKTKISRGVLNLKGEIKWMLTGTPIVNKLPDIQPLLSFLGVEPFDNPSWFHRLIERPVAMGDGKGLETLNLILRYYLLRRLKTTKVKKVHLAGSCSSSSAGPPSRCLLELPPKQFHVVKVQLHKDHRRMYDRLFALCSERLLLNAGVAMEEQRLSNAAVASRNFLKETLFLSGTANVLSFISRLRQVLQHAALLPKAWADALLTDDAVLVRKLLTEQSICFGGTAENGGKKKSPLELFRAGHGTDCSVCLCGLDDETVRLTKCGHLFHLECIREAVIK
eukprot:g18026.t1